MHSSHTRKILPGFNLSLGYAVTYLSLIVLIPLGAAFYKAAGMGWNDLVAAATSPRVLASYKLTFSVSLYAALTNLAFGTLLAWVLARYRFPGRRIADAIVDLPFALPTAVAGIALATVYSQNGWIGKHLYALGIESAYSPTGIYIALTFISLPFVVRTVQPIIEQLDPELEEAAAILGASRLGTFARVILPTLLPPMLTGFAISFARAIGEYGSVVFISGNMPMKTEITPLLIITKLEQYQYAEATAIACASLVVSFLLLLAINLLQRWAVVRSR